MQNLKVNIQHIGYNYLANMEGIEYPNISRLILSEQKPDVSKNYGFEVQMEVGMNEIEWAENFKSKFHSGLIEMIDKIESDCDGCDFYRYENEQDAIFETRLSTGHQWGQIILPLTNFIFGYYFEPQKDFETYYFGSKLQFSKKEVIE